MPEAEQEGFKECLMRVRKGREGVVRSAVINIRRLAALACWSYNPPTSRGLALTCYTDSGCEDTMLRRHDNTWGLIDLRILKATDRRLHLG